MMKDRLLESGVDPDNIDVVPDEQEATIAVLQKAQPGDLVLILADNIKRTWKQIIYFNPELGAADVSAKKPASLELPELDEFSLDESLDIISDERGVRIAREAGD